MAEFTNGGKADVVYESVGRVSFDASLDCLRPRGLMVSFGAATGTPPPVEMSTLNAKGSLYVTRPYLAAHTGDGAEYRRRAVQVWDAVESGIITPRIAQHYPLGQAADAHRAIESGKAGRRVILIPWQDLSPAKMPTTEGASPSPCAAFPATQ